MSDFDRPGATLPGPVKQRPKASRFANLGDRLARTFGSYDKDLGETHAWSPLDVFNYEDAGNPPAWDPPEPRFPVARLGYDRGAVDEHLAELERQLAELQAGAPPGEVVSAEIEKIGEQTSAILTVAHDQAQEMTRQAQEQADRCLADAASNAVMITEEAKRRLRQLDVDTDAVWRERARLVEDVRAVSSSLASIADDAVARFPAEPEHPDPDRSEPADPEPSASTPAATDAVEAHPPEPDQAATTHMSTIAEDGQPAVAPHADGQATQNAPADEQPAHEQPWFGT